MLPFCSVVVALREGGHASQVRQLAAFLPAAVGGFALKHCPVSPGLNMARLFLTTRPPQQLPLPPSPVVHSFKSRPLSNCYLAFTWTPSIAWSLSAPRQIALPWQ